MFLVLLETSGNQPFIFATNKLRENVGASELTYQAGTKWVLEAVKAKTGKYLYNKDSEKFRRKLLDPELNPKIEEPDTAVEVIVATSGKALLLTKEEDQAKQIIQQVTLKALKDAPGLEICGVFKEFNWEKNNLGSINRDVHKLLEQARSLKPSSAFRFLRLPVIDECRTSGLPASELLPLPGEGKVPVSRLTASKRSKSVQDSVRIRLKKLLSKAPEISKAVIRRKNPLRFASEIDEIDSDWIAVVHADGNGLGEIFLNFQNHLDLVKKANDPKGNRSYIDQLRKFSIALDICTEKAFLSAIHDLPRQEHKPEILTIVPLILGGDDITVICEGRSALKFTQRFLKAFEDATANPAHHLVDGIIPEIATKALGVGRLSAGAGVAIIKPHFPFSVAYKLASDLIRSAKKAKEIITSKINDKNIPYPCSTIDFHVLYDSSDVDLDAIRDKLKLKPDTIHLYRRPYVVTDKDKIPPVINGLNWAEFHHWNELIKRVGYLTAKDEDGRRLLPNSQMHDLRSSLFAGKAVADGRYLLIRDRYKDQRIIELAGSSESLFQKELDSDIESTMLLDVIEVAEFLR